jgi:hypothetical protein
MTKNKSENKQGRKPLEAKRTTKGPEPERIKFSGNWVEAVDIALKAKRPKTGWPK